MYPPRPRIGIQPLTVYLLVLAAFAGGVLMDRAGWLPGSGHCPSELGPTYGEAWNLVEKYYVDRKAVNADKMTQYSIMGMLLSLGDLGHTTYLSRDEYRQQMNSLKGELTGIGVLVSLREKKPTIRYTYPDSPAREAGLKPGDVFYEVAGKPVAEMSWEQTIKLIQGTPGTTVKIGVLRKGTNHPITFTVKRARLHIPVVSWQVLPGVPVAHITLRDFGERTDEQLREAIEQARAKGAKGLLIDVRGNGGGIKDQAVKVTSEFLKGGTVFVERNAQGQEKGIPVEKGGVATDIPICVLIDGGSASSSEIFAGAIQDSERGKLVGTRTFGTGTVLGVFRLSDGSAVFLAVAEWLTPKGRQIWHKGISPDIKVDLPEGASYLLPEEEAGMDEAQMRKTKDKVFLTALGVLEKQLNLKPQGQQAVAGKK